MMISCCLITAYGLIFSYMCIKKYITFRYYDWDLAIYTNILWNLVHGKFYSSLLGKNFLLDHASFIAFVTAIPYFIFRHPVSLLILQSFAIAISALPIFLVARDKFKDISAVMFTLLYLCYPALHYANLYEFNFEILSLPFLSFAFYYLLKNKRHLFYLMCILACSCKENIPLTVIALGIFGILRPHRRALGFMAVLIGISWFLLDMYLLPVYIKNVTWDSISHGKAGGYIWLFSKYGKGPIDIILYVVSHPLDIVRTVFDGPRKQIFFNNMFGSLLFLPLLRPDVLIADIPHILIRMLSSDVHEQTVYYHSAAPLAPFIFFALIFYAKTMFNCFPKAVNYKRLLFIILFGSQFIFALIIWQSRPWADFRHTDAKADQEEMLKCVPKNASIAASFGFLSHLADREHVYSLHTFFGNIEWKKTPAKAPDYILFEGINSFLSSFFESKGLFDKGFFQYLLKNNFSLVKARGDILLFKKDYNSGQKIFEIEKDVMKFKDGPLFKIDNELELLKMEARYIEEEGRKIALFTFYWKPEAILVSDYMMRIFVRQDKEILFYSDHVLGYSMYPPSMWSKGDIIKENYWFGAPDLKPGRYMISVLIVDLNTKKIKEERFLCVLTSKWAVKR